MKSKKSKKQNITTPTPIPVQSQTKCEKKHAAPKPVPFSRNCYVCGMPNSEYIFEVLKASDITYTYKEHRLLIACADCYTEILQVIENKRLPRFGVNPHLVVPKFEKKTTTFKEYT